MRFIQTGDFPPFDTEIPDQYRLDVFLRDFKKYVNNKDLPNLVVMTLCTDHTSGTSAGYPTPEAQVADNDLAAAGMVDVFQDGADVKPYNVIPNQIALDALNPSTQAGLERAWQHWSATIFPHGPGKKPDVADPNVLNHAIWYAGNHFRKPYPGDSRLLFPKEVRRSEKPDADE